MDHKLHYGTVTEALAEFRKQGFNIDFNIAGDVITHPEGKLRADELTLWTYIGTKAILIQRMKQLFML